MTSISLPALEGPSRGKGPRSSWRLPAGHGGRCDGRLSVDPRPGILRAGDDGSVIQENGIVDLDGIQHGRRQLQVIGIGGGG